jgi:DNA-binding transcriptional ArsR family regulator
MRRDVFQAIADPTRREIIRMISREQMNVNAVAQKFDISRPAIYKHLKILKECGLVSLKQKGREHICEPRLKKIVEVARWADQYRVFWESKLDDLDRFLRQS